MLILRQKTLQAKIDAAIALLPKPEPVADLTPDLEALRQEIRDLKVDWAQHSTAMETAIYQRIADEAGHRAEAIAAIPQTVAMPDMTPLDERILNCELGVIQLGVRVVEATSAAKQTDDLATYLLESPPVIREITTVADPSTSVLAAFQGHWVRPMGQ